jgi:hypothetical protein
MSKEGKRDRGVTIRLVVTLLIKLGAWLVAIGRLGLFPGVAILYCFNLDKNLCKAPVTVFLNAVCRNL